MSHRNLVSKPPTFSSFRTEENLLNQFRNATGNDKYDFGIFGNDVAENREDKSDVKNLSFLQKMRFIKEEEEEEIDNHKTEEIEEEGDYISLRKDISIFSPFSKPRDAKLPPAKILHGEIIDVVKFIEEKKEEREAREEIIQNLSKAIKSIISSSKVEAYGSFRCNLMIPGSDIDVQVTVYEWKNVGNEKKHIVRILQNLVQKLSDPMNNPLIDGDFKLIAEARIPILRCKDLETGQPLDISVKMEKIVGKRPKNSVDLNEDMLLKYSKKCPAFRYLVLVLKLFLRQRRLNDVHIGGLSSFGLCLMVMSFLQHHVLVNGSKNDRKGISLGTLLLDFFGLYGIHFNYRDVAIDVGYGGKYLRKYNVQNTGDRRNNAKLYILNPNDKNHIVTSGTYQMGVIRTAFKDAFHKLIAEKKVYEQSCNGLLSRILRIPEELIEREIYFRSRRKV